MLNGKRIPAIIIVIIVTIIIIALYAISCLNKSDIIKDNSTIESENISDSGVTSTLYDVITKAEETLSSKTNESTTLATSTEVATTLLQDSSTSQKATTSIMPTTTIAKDTTLYNPNNQSSDDILLLDAEKYYEQHKAEIMQLFNYTNSIRKANNVAEFIFDETLTICSIARSMEMINHSKEVPNFLSHSRPVTNAGFNTILPSDYKFKKLGENILNYYGNPSNEFIDRWFASESHRNNILDSEFNYMGIGFYSNGTEGRAAQFFSKK